MARSRSRLIGTWRACRQFGFVTVACAMSTVAVCIPVISCGNRAWVRTFLRNLSQSEGNRTEDIKFWVSLDALTQPPEGFSSWHRNQPR